MVRIVYAVFALQVLVPTWAWQPSDQPFTRYSNVAVGKSPKASSEEFAYIGEGLASAANDGMSSSDPSAGDGCFQAASSDQEPFWYVDLGRVIMVSGVRLTNRGDCCGTQLTDFKVELFTMKEPDQAIDVGVDCVSRITTPVELGATEQFMCFPGPAPGRWVRIHKLGASLTLCEVEVLEAENEKEWTSLQCDFEDPDMFGTCGLFPAPSAAAQWTRGSGSTPTAHTGPQSDHTTGGTFSARAGHYMFLNRAAVQGTNTAELVTSPFVGPPGPYCLTFWYHKYGAGVGELHAGVYDTGLTTNILLWRADDNSIDLWRKAELPFYKDNTIDSFRVIITAIAETTGNAGDVAIDDITIVNTFCPVANMTPSNSIDCDFNDPSGRWCGYGQPYSEGIDWVWTNTGVPNQVISQKDPSSYFMYTSSNTLAAFLTSPYYKPTFPRSCLRFRYSIGGGGRLAMFLKEGETYPSEDLGANLGEVSSAEITQWTSVQMDITTPRPFRLSITAMGTGVAVDDISISSMDCSSVETLTCNFDNLVDVCGFFQSADDNFDFSLQDAAIHPLNGPASDHTGPDIFTNKPSLYLFTNIPPNTSAGGFAALHSPIIATDAEQSCLAFWYQMRGPDPQGTMKVITSTPYLTEQKVIWALSRGYQVEPRDEWRRAAVTIDTKKPTRLTFYVSITNTNYPDALDDISLSKGPCLSERNVSLTFICQMEVPDLCGMGQVTMDDDSDWTWASGNSSDLDTGPEGDHTTGNGYYLYLESSSHMFPGDRAAVHTPIILPGFPKTCLTFAYHMHGAAVGALDVLLHNKPLPPQQQGGAVRKWSKQGDQGPGWKIAKVTLDTIHPYKVLFVGEKGQNATGDIAIDDIHIINNECSPDVDHLVCNFEESMCGLVQWPWDNFDWTRTSGPSRSISTGPSSDRTDPKGRYLYLDTTSPRRLGDVARLVSPVVETGTATSCLAFWYHVNARAPVDPGSLMVLVSDPELQMPLKVWSVTRSQGTGWRRAAVTVDSTLPSRFVFEGKAGSPGQSTVALDDISLTKGPCPFDRLITKLKCDFNEPHLCGFGQALDDNFEWLWHEGPTPDHPSTGPKEDHGEQGHYLYIESSEPQKTGEMATLISPSIRTARPKSCLTFWYHMKGKTVGTLRVAALLSGHRKYQIWRKSGAQGDGWQMGSVELDASPAPFQLLFEGVMSSGSTGDIALDDVELLPKPCIHKSSVDCDFDDVNICGYEPITGNGTKWTQVRSNRLKNANQATDHTSGRGSFMYAGESPWTSTLVSPSLYWKQSQGCLTFKHDVAEAARGTLNVYVVPTGLLDERTRVFSSGLNSPGTASVDIQSPYPIQILFEGVREPGFQGNITVDDIKMYPDACDKPLDCDFTNNMCGYTQHSGDIKWQQGSGETPSNDTGPSADHTDGTGSYAFSNAAYGESGVLQSRVLDWKSEVNCLSFWYNMHGQDIGSLTVFMASPSNESLERQELWSRTGQHDREWHNVQVDFIALKPLRLYIEATKDGLYTTEGDSAVDDIVTRRGVRCGDPAQRTPVDCDFEKDLCGYKQLTTDSDDDWHVLDGLAPKNVHGSGVLYLPSHHQSEGARTTALMESPVLGGSPRKICLRFWWKINFKAEYNTALTVHVLDADTRTTIDKFNSSQYQNQGWQLEEISLDFNAPMLFRFEVTPTLPEQRQKVDIGMDDVKVTTDPCRPVPWTETWKFRCDRPTTRCLENQGVCDANSKQCKCRASTLGLQCTPVRVPCTVNPCVRGDCHSRGGFAVCECPDGYYGDKCQHKMVHVECTYDKMVVNVFPYGFTEEGFKNLKTPEVINKCPLLPMSVFRTSSKQYGHRGWDGYAREFMHDDDPCAGSATVVKQTAKEKTYMRQIYVYYDPLGRHKTDTILKVKCSADHLPPPSISMNVKELGISVYSRSQLHPLQRGWPSYVEFKFAVNIPNNANAMELKAQACTAVSNSHKMIVVRDSCVVHPVGVMLNAGAKQGEEDLMLRVFKVPGTRTNLDLNCSFRLCDPTKNDFSCYKRDMCFNRMKRSAAYRNTRAILGNIIANVHFDMEGRMDNYTYTYRPV